MISRQLNYQGDAEGLRMALIKLVMEQHDLVPEKGVAHITGAQRSKAYVDGERHAYKMVLDILHDVRVTP